MKFCIVTLILFLGFSAKAQQDILDDIDIETLLFKEQKVSYNKLRSNLINFSDMFTKYYDELDAMVKSELDKSKDETVDSVEARRKICRKMGSTANVVADPFIQAFNMFNLINDAILTHGTDEDLNSTSSGKPLFENLLNTKNIYQLILLQNEHIRSMGFCSEDNEILQLDFRYNVVAVRPDNISELSEATSFILEVSQELLASLNATPEDDAVVSWNIEDYGSELFQINSFQEPETIEL